MREQEARARRFAKQMRRTLTNAETILWSRLQRRALNGVRFRRQHPIGPYIADFACLDARLVIEVDGATHGTDEQAVYDARRSAYLRSQGWQELRVTNGDVYHRLDGVLEAILERVHGEG